MAGLLSTGKAEKVLTYSSVLISAVMMDKLLFTDQRKHISGALGASTVCSLVEKARIMPSIVCLFSRFTSSHFGHENIPQDCCLVSYSQTRAYHGAMWVHPAASPSYHAGYTLSKKLVW